MKSLIQTDINKKNTHIMSLLIETKQKNIVLILNPRVSMKMQGALRKSIFKIKLFIREQLITKK